MVEERDQTLNKNVSICFSKVAATEDKLRSSGPFPVLSNRVPVEYSYFRPRIGHLETASQNSIIHCGFGITLNQTRYLRRELA